jgi:hypothetical protein
LDLLHLYTQLVITCSTALPLNYTLQFTLIHTLGFSVFTSRILATNFNTVIIPVSLQIPHLKPPLHRLTFKSQLHSLPFLFNPFRLLSQETPSIITPAGLVSLYSLRADPTENAVSVVIAQKYLDCCLLFHCGGDLFTESLPSNKHLFWLRYSDFQASYHNILNYTELGTAINCVD